MMIKKCKSKTIFVKKLLNIRNKAIKNRMKLLTIDEILQEKESRRK